MMEVILQEVTCWIFGPTKELGQERKHPDSVRIEGILDFLTTCVNSQRLKSMSYMGLLRNFHLNKHNKHLGYSTLVYQQAECCDQMDPEYKEKAPVTDIMETIKGNPYHMVAKTLSADDTNSSANSFNHKLLSHQAETHYAASMLPNDSPSFRSKFFVKPGLLRDKDDETYGDICDNDNGDDDVDDYEESGEDGARNNFLDLGDFSDSECDDTEAESDPDDSESDDDILFCDGITSDIQSSNDHEHKRVRFKSQAGIFEVDSRWSDDDLMDARKGPWEEYARDGERFRQRIKETERKISWILDVRHRHNTFTARFSQ